ncbi:MAG: hypothetical protein JJ920_20860 [Roseitalea sp.]|nr:hypothetical protein [Roseitalea sp.]MBO6728031.1 hypothetical protein [Rhizobiaceae bacterium]MBO6745362.1 hypothetical protein [Roseitalea sp.]
MNRSKFNDAQIAFVRLAIHNLKVQQRLSYYKYLNSLNILVEEARNQRYQQFLFLAAA